MLEFIVGTAFAVIAFYFTEKDNKNSELYKILHEKK